MLVKEPEPKAAAQVVGQLPANVNLTLYQGDDFFLDLTVTGAANLTGYTPKADIRAALGATAILASFDATINNPTTVRLHLSGDQSTLLTGPAVWDVQVVDAAGLVTTLAYGTITVTKQVTL